MRSDDVRLVVANAESFELALFVEVVHGFERDVVWGGAVWSV